MERRVLIANRHLFKPVYKAWQDEMSQSCRTRRAEAGERGGDTTVILARLESPADFRTERESAAHSWAILAARRLREPRGRARPENYDPVRGECTWGATRDGHCSGGGGRDPLAVRNQNREEGATEGHA